MLLAFYHEQMGCGLLLLISIVHGQLLDALVDEEASRKGVGGMPCVLDVDVSATTLHNYLIAMERDGQKGTERYVALQKAHALALHDTFVAAGPETMDERCASIELRRSAEYAMCLTLSAEAHESAKAFHIAVVRYEEGIALNEELGLVGSSDFRTMVCNLGTVYYKADERDKARASLQRCVKFFEAAGDVMSLAYAVALRNFGIVARNSDSFPAFVKAKFVLELLGLQNTKDFQLILAQIERFRTKK
jgi:hypothetical protein